MKQLTILIKPASSLCNLNCSYCFYKDVASLRDQASFGYMKEETMENILLKSFQVAEEAVSFIFQGGEPTLVGLDFYENFIELQKKHNHKRLNIHYSIQTNGTLLDEKWVRFFKENNFLVGLSLDGTKAIHDLNRVDVKGKGSFKEIDRNIALLKKYKVDFNILSVVTKNLVRHTMQVYNFFKSKDLRYLQFIPCIDDFELKSGDAKHSLTPEKYSEFLITLFDLWYQDFLKRRRVSIRMFDNILSMLAGYEPESCDMRGICSTNLVIESDGSCYPCDFYVLDQWELGNINKQSIEELIIDNKVSRDFITSSRGPGDICMDCVYYKLCRGGCRRYHEMNESLGEEGQYFCAAYKAFYKHSLPKFLQLLNSY